jgi:filamentous hemagglutinin
VGDVNITTEALHNHREYQTKSFHSIDDTVENVGSTITSGGNFTANAVNNINIAGSDITAVGDASLTAANDVNITSVQDSEYHYRETKKKSSSLAKGFDSTGALGFGSDKNSKHESQTITNVASNISGNNVNITSGANTVVVASNLTATNDVNINSGGIAYLGAAKDADYESNSKSSKSLNWQSMSGSGHSDETVVHTKISAGGDVNINALQGVIVDIKNGGTVQQSIDKLATQPGLEYLADLKNNPNVDWNKINEAHKNWNYKSQGLTEVGAAIVTIVVTVATMNSAAVQGLAAKAGTAAGTATGAASVSAAAYAGTIGGMSALTSQASVSLINNQGDIGKTLRDIGSSETIKSVLVSAATAGAIAGLSNAAGVAGKFSDFKLVDQAKKVVITVGATATVDSIINGTDLGKNLVSSLKTTLVSAVGSNAAGLIGERLDGISAAVAHAALGCAEGAVGGGGCTGGAIGAVAGELIAKEQLSKSSTELYQDAFADNILTPEEQRALINGLDVATQSAIDTAKLAGALAALAAGEDAAGINAAANAAAIAAENNATSFMQEATAMIAAGRTLTAAASAITVAGGELAAGAVACVASVGCGLVVLAAVATAAGTMYVLGYNKDANLNLAGVNSGTSTSGSTASAGAPMPDPDDEDDFDPNNAKYEDASYHHSNTNGLKNPAPKDPNTSLQNSVRISENSTRRISVDSINNEFVVFDETQPGLWHGHTRTWTELNQQMKNALIKAGRVTIKGKIL